MCLFHPSSRGSFRHDVRPLEVSELSNAGQLLDSRADPQGIAVTTALSLLEGPSLESGASGETLVVRNVTPPTHALWDLRAARYSASGSLNVTDPAGTPLLRRGWILSPAAAGCGGALLVWLTPAAATPSSIGAMAVYAFGP
jgi:hypothetical protein